MNAPAFAACPSSAERGAHVIVIGNEKGGAGKSTVAMHLAVALLRLGKPVAAIDLDTRQRTLSRYVENRRAWAQVSGARLPMPFVAAATLSLAPVRALAEAEEGDAFTALLAELRRGFDFVLIDAPGADTHLSRRAHACADTLVTPLNDSFVDFDLLGEVEPETFEVVRPSLYAEMVWDCRKRKAQSERQPMDWVVMRNRVSPSRIEARNTHRMAAALERLSGRIGYRLAPGFSERVVFRDLYPRGLTLLDLVAEGGADSGLGMGHLAARQEVRDLLAALRLPGLSAGPLAG